MHRIGIFFSLVLALNFLAPSFAVEPAADLPGPVRLTLPPVLYAVVGLETNLYFDNVVLVLDPNDYAFDVTCAHGVQQTERWTYTPQAGEEGSYPLSLEVRDAQNALLARATTRLEVLAADTGKDRAISMLMLGDSLTHASIYPQHLLKLCQPAGNPKLTLIGSHTPAGKPPEVRHEGYGGWTAERFATSWTGIAREGEAAKRGSPFLYEGAEHHKQLDFARYLKDIGVSQPPGFVAIFLGPNDVFAPNDDSIEVTVDWMLKNYDALIAMVHRVSPQTRIGVMLPVPPSATQDAFGANYRNGQTRWQYKRNTHRLVERMLAAYGNRESENIFLVPTEVNLDCLHNYPVVSCPANARTESTSLRQLDSVHPAVSGYQQIGDSLYAWLKGQLR